MRKIIIHADEWAADVGLLVQVCEPEAAESGCVVEDRGLVLGREPGGEGVPSLCGEAVDPVDDLGDVCWCGGGVWELGCGLGEDCWTF